MRLNLKIKSQNSSSSIVLKTSKKTNLKRFVSATELKTSIQSKERIHPVSILSFVIHFRGTEMSAMQ